jgi:hypothetical protein
LHTVLCVLDSAFTCCVARGMNDAVESGGKGSVAKNIYARPTTVSGEAIAGSFEAENREMEVTCGTRHEHPLFLTLV